MTFELKQLLSTDPIYHCDLYQNQQLLSDSERLQLIRKIFNY